MSGKQKLCVGAFVRPAALPAGRAARQEDDFDHGLETVSAGVLKGTRTSAQRAGPFHKAALDAGDDKRMHRALLERAFEHRLAGVPNGACCQVAEQSLDGLEVVAPGEAETWRRKRVELRRTWYRRATARKDKAHVAAMLVEALLRGLLDKAFKGEL